MKTEEKGVPHVRLAVLGKFNVGKSAIAVRYLTRRFIGEYRSETDMIYNRAVVVNGTLMDVEIVEVSDKTGKSMTQASQLAADGVVVAYSIVDRDSYEYAKDVVPLLAKQRMPIALMANKADLTQYRTVEESEGRALAKDAGTPYYEVSVAENSDSLYQAFELIVGQCHALLNNNNNNNNSNNNADNCRNNNNNNNSSSRSRKFSVSKMLGMVIGSKSSSPPPASTASPQRGTVVAYQRTELFSVLKQRHRSPATASL